MTANTCLVCGNKDHEVSKMHHFPTNMERSKIWQEKLGIKFCGQSLKSYRICSKHFSRDDYVDLIGYRLRRDAVPIAFGASLTTSKVTAPSGLEYDDLEHTVGEASEMEPSSSDAEDLPPFKKIKLGPSPRVADTASYSIQLDESEIKIEPIVLQSEQGPVQDTSFNCQVVSAKPPDSPLILRTALKGTPVATPQEPIILRKVPPPKGVILRKIKSIAASQAQVIQKLNIAPKVVLLQQGQSSSAGASKPVSDTVDLTSGPDEIEENGSQTQEGGEISSGTGTELTGSNKDSDPIVQAYKCKVLGCIEKTKYYFPAPFNTKALNIWRHCLRNATLQPGHLLCSKHFLDVDILELPDKGCIAKLKDHVVPSVKPVETGCIIPGCPNQDVNAPNMYPIPVWGNYLPWVQGYFNRFKYKNDLLRYRVCELHFANVNSKNMFDLVPSLNLPNEVTVGGQTRLKPANVCAHIDCDGDQQMVKFPKNYSRCIDFLTLCERNDILLKSYSEIQQFLASSKGVCIDHFKEITAAIKKKENNDSAAINNALGKPQENKEPSENEDIYVPIRDYCAFINCSTSAKRLGVAKYRFPVNSNHLKQKWKLAAGIPDIIKDEDLKVLFVCEKHFTKDQFTPWHTLQMTSVPLSHEAYVDPKATDANVHWMRKKRITRKKYQTTVLEPNAAGDSVNNSASSSNVPEWLTNYEPIRSNTCCVKHCRADGNSTILFDFPTSPALRRVWIKAVENCRDFTYNNSSQRYNGKKICCAHFEERFRVGDDALNPNAFPTLNLIKETEIKGEKLDTGITWTRCESDVCDEDPKHILGHIKGKAILRKDSIEFPNIKRQLKFGKDCRKRGVNKYPYKVYRLPVKASSSIFEFVGEGHQLQIHTAIIIDDDDESEKAAVDMICEIIKRNEGSTKKGRKETKGVSEAKDN